MSRPKQGASQTLLVKHSKAFRHLAKLIPAKTALASKDIFGFDGGFCYAFALKFNFLVALLEQTRNPHQISSYRD